MRCKIFLQGGLVHTFFIQEQLLREEPVFRAVCVCARKCVCVCARCIINRSLQLSDKSWRRLPSCTGHSPFCGPAFDLSLSSVRVLLPLLPGETGQPGAQQHGGRRPGPRAVIRPANLTGTCEGRAEDIISFHPFILNLVNCQREYLRRALDDI